MSQYPQGVTRPEEYREYLASGLRKREARLRQAGTAQERLAAGLELSRFALAEAAEPGLSRVWLWGESGVRPERAVHALRIAGQALDDVRRTAREIGASAGAEPRIESLSALLAVETCLLGAAGQAEPVRAANQAEAARATASADTRSNWDLLVAGCLLKAGRLADADLRLQRVSRLAGGSAASVAAVVLQSRTLAKQGNHAAAVALVTEYLEARPAMAAAAKVDGKVARSTLLLAKANLLREWAEQLRRSGSEFDRGTAEQLDGKAQEALAASRAAGPDVLRLRPILGAASGE